MRHSRRTFQKKKDFLLGQSETLFREEAPSFTPTYRRVGFILFFRDLPPPRGVLGQVGSSTQRAPDAPLSDLLPSRIKIEELLKSHRCPPTSL